ncbi:MAG: glycosyltransferase family 2 protein [Salinibacterium sp.]|nr:glycosyltransferase family 2 protein [Salinibacterium sp.]
MKRPDHQYPRARRALGSKTALSRISVVIPCCNYGRYLRACVASVLAQEGVDLDVTIVDDASSDDSAALAVALAAEDSRVRVVIHETNLGHIATFNEALGLASAEFVVKMDADDLVPPGAFLRAATLLAANPSMAFVYGYPQTFASAPPTYLESRVRSWSVWDGQDWLKIIADRGHNSIMQPEVMMRRSAIEQVGGHRPEIPESSDLNLWLRLASVGTVGRVNGPVQGLYRIHDQSMQRTIHAGLLRDLRGRVAAFDLFFAERGDSLSRASELRATASRALAREAVRLAQRAFDRRAAETEPIAEYLAIASQLCPQVTKTRAWLRVGALIRARETHPEQRRPSPVDRFGSVVRDLEDKVRWRRWRRYGR